MVLIVGSRFPTCAPVVFQLHLHGNERHKDPTASMNREYLVTKVENK